MPSNEATLRNLPRVSPPPPPKSYSVDQGPIVIRDCLIGTGGAGSVTWNWQGPPKPSQMVRDNANRCWRDPATGSRITDAEVYASRTLPGLPYPPAQPKRQPMQSWQRLDLRNKHRRQRAAIARVRFYRRHRAALASLLMAAAVLLAGWFLVR